MTLSPAGEARVNGYLFVLQRSLRTFLPAESVRDAVREIESHLRDRIAAAEPVPDERQAVERILAELGPPLRVAQAYSLERTVDEAIATGRVVAMVRALWHLAVSTAVGFGAALCVIVGTLFGIASIAVALAKPIFPANAGFFLRDGDVVPHTFGAQFPVPPGEHVVGGYWVIPFGLATGMVVLVLTYRGAGRFLTWWRERRAL